MGLRELLTEITKQVNQGCISNSCSGDGCRVYLTDVPSARIIVDLECEFKQQKINTKRCVTMFSSTEIHPKTDWLLFSLNSRAAPLKH